MAHTKNRCNYIEITKNIGLEQHAKWWYCGQWKWKHFLSYQYNENIQILKL